MAKQEERLHLQVAEYLKEQYPKVIFRTDFAAGIKMTINQAKKHKKLQSGRAYPDLFIASPRKGFSGLYIELKADGATLYRKDGTLSQTEHIQEQAQVLLDLIKEGYSAKFAQGFEQAKQEIDKYLGNSKEVNQNEIF